MNKKLNLRCIKRNVNGVNSNVTLILFALHYIQQNARSTVQTEQAMPEMLEGVGPGRVKWQQI